MEYNTYRPDSSLAGSRPSNSNGGGPNNTNRHAHSGLTWARRRIKDLETELELVKAAGALSNGEEVVRPKRLGPVVRGLTDPLARRNYPCGPLGPSGGAA